jgi:hypothetical protein
MKIYLEVPFKEKESAKNKGCKWDSVKNKWFIENPEYTEDFKKWIPAYMDFENKLKPCGKPKAKRKSNKRKVLVSSQTIGFTKSTKSTIKTGI